MKAAPKPNNNKTNAIKKKQNNGDDRSQPIPECLVCAALTRPPPAPLMGGHPMSDAAQVACGETKIQLLV